MLGSSKQDILEVSRGHGGALDSATGRLHLASSDISFSLSLKRDPALDKSPSGTSPSNRIAALHGAVRAWWVHGMFACFRGRMQP